MIDNTEIDSVNSKQLMKEDIHRKSDVPPRADVVESPGPGSVPCRTKGDGNCFFHAVFGTKNRDGEYETACAGDMRREWHNYLAQFNSLKDEGMPIELKDQLKKIFNLFLNDSRALTGQSILIKVIVEETREKICNCIKEVETLKKDIADRFEIDKKFKKNILIKCFKNKNKDIGLLENRAFLISEISNNLEECAKIYYPNLTRLQLKMKYNLEWISDNFLENSDVYKHYLNAIKSTKYYVFFEEVPILASLGNVTVIIYRNDENNRHEIITETFEPNHKYLGNYKSNFTWGNVKNVAIHYTGSHFSRVETSSNERPLADVESTVDISGKNNLSEYQDESASQQRPPLCSAMKVDLNLCYGRTNWQELLVTTCQHQQNISKINAEAVPSAHVLAQLSQQVYEDLKGESDDQYEKRLILPSGWRLLTTAQNINFFNGYFGAAFWHSKLCLLVVAHRGTNSFGAIFTDFESVVMNKFSSHMNSAVTFTLRVFEVARERLGTDWGAALTGHSLGGWLAQLSCLSAAHLRVFGTDFVLSTKRGVHAHCVAFESPGCVPMLEEIADAYDLRQHRRMCIPRLDITTYVSAPNLVNTCNSHAGTLFRIFPDLKYMGFWDRTFLYTKVTHNMCRIADVFDEKTGTVRRDEQGTLKMLEVVDWPRYKGKEYESFFKLAKFSNNYHPDQRDVIPSGAPPYARIRYQSQGVDETRCKVSRFSSDELLLLEGWAMLKKVNTKFRNLQRFTQENNLGNAVDLLPLFEINNEGIVLCNEMRTLVNRTKQLLRGFKVPLMEAMKVQLDSATDAIFLLESKTFWTTVAESDVNFEDEIELCNFLKMSTKTVLCITAEDTDLEVVRIYNICCQFYNESFGEHAVRHSIENSYIIILSISQIIKLLDFVDIRGLLKLKSKYGCVIVVFEPACKQELDENRDMVEKLFYELKNNDSSKKVILMAKKESPVTSYISDFHLGAVLITKDVKPISYSDISEESRKKILEKPFICLNGDRLSLRVLFGDKSNNFYVDLFNEMKLIFKYLIALRVEDIQIGNIKDALYDVFFIKIGKNTTLESAFNFMLNTERNIKLFSKPLVFLISGIQSNCKTGDELSSYFDIRQKERKKIISNAFDKSIFISTEHEDSELKFKQISLRSSDKRVYWLNVKERLATWEMVYDADFYITRKLNDQILLKNDIFDLWKRDTRDCLIFSKCSKETSRVFNISDKLWGKISNSRNVLLTTEEISHVNFEEKCRENNLMQFESVHLIHVDELARKLEWVKSSGPLDNIRDYTILSNNEIDEQAFTGKWNKVVIVSGDPGVGKSTTFRNLPKKMKSSWVIYKELKNADSIVQHPKGLSIDIVVSFLLENSSYSGDLTSELLKQCITRKCSVPVIVIFDGFDEITYGSYKNERRTYGIPTRGEDTKVTERFLELFEFLKEKTTTYIWISSRNFAIRLLENKLSQFSAKLVNMKEEEQKQILRNIWFSRFSVSSENFEKQDDKRVDESIEKLSVKAKLLFSKDIANFSCIPLHVRMIAEVMEPNYSIIRQSSTLQSASLENIFSVTDLYTRFVEVKYQIYFEKCELPNTVGETLRNYLTNVLNKNMKYLALKVLFPQWATVAVTSRMLDVGSENFEKEERELNCVGLIQSRPDGHFSFIHRTFAEYFVSELFILWISKEHGRHQKYPPVEKFLVSQILIEPDYKTIRLFLNSRLAVKQPPSDAISHSAAHVWKMWDEDREVFLNEQRQTALHVAAEEDCAHLVAYLHRLTMAEAVSPATAISFLTARDCEGRTALLTAAQAGSQGAVGAALDCLRDARPGVAREVVLATLLRRTGDSSHLGVQNLLEVLNEGVAGMEALESAALADKLKDINKTLDMFSNASLDSLRDTVNQCPDELTRRYMLAVVDDNGNTALHNAMLIVKHWKNIYRDTDKSFVRYSKSLEKLTFLLIEGASVDAKNDAGLTPLLVNAKSRCMFLLISWSDSFYSMMGREERARHFYTVYREYDDINRPLALLAAGADPQCVDGYGIAPLAYAAISDHPELVWLLLSQGAAPAAVDCFGMTALKWAIRFGLWVPAALLLAAEAAPGLPGAHGRRRPTRAAEGLRWTCVVRSAADAPPVTVAEALEQALASNRWRDAERLLELVPRVPGLSSLSVKTFRAVNGNLGRRLLLRGLPVHLRHDVTVDNAISSILKDKADPYSDDSNPIAPFSNADAFAEFVSQINLDAYDEAGFHLAPVTGSFQCSFASPTFHKLPLRALAAIARIYHNLTHGSRVTTALPMHVRQATEELVVRYRFFSSASSSTDPQPPPKEVFNYVDAFAKSVRDLRHYYTLMEMVDEVFLNIATTIALDLKVLKRFLKSELSMLPWNEMEFYVVSFVSSIVEPEENDEVYELFLDEFGVMELLELFSKNLTFNFFHRNKGVDKKGKILGRNKGISCRTKYKKLKKKINPIEIISEFKHLYKEYDILRNVYCLKRLNFYLKRASEIDLKEKGELAKHVIVRALQVLGKGLQNNADSTGVSDDVREMLLSFAPVRDVLSHADSLKGLINIETIMGKQFFDNVQNGITQIGKEVCDILYSKKNEAFKYFLKKIRHSTSKQEVDKLYFKLQKSTFSEINFSEFRAREFSKLQTLVEELKSNFGDENEKFKTLTDKLNDILIAKKRKIWKHCENYDGILESSRFLRTSINYETIKEFSTIHLIQSDNTDLNDLLIEINNSVEFEIPNDMRYLFIRIFYFMGCKIQGFLGNVFKKQKIDIYPSKRLKEEIQGDVSEDQRQMRATRYRELMALLKEVVKAVNEASEAEVEAALVAAEMLVLESLEVLEDAGMLTDDSRLAPLHECPVLVGKALLNYLAHGDPLADVMACSPRTAVLAHSRLLPALTDSLATSAAVRVGGCGPALDVSALRRRDACIGRLARAQRDLMVAAARGDEYGARLAVAAGAVPGAPSVSPAHRRRTALQLAVGAGSEETLRYFVEDLDQGMDLAATLVLAASEGSVWMLHYLCYHYNLQLRTPTLLSAQSIDHVEWLLDRFNKSEQTVELSSWRSRKAVLEVLVDESNNSLLGRARLKAIAENDDLDHSSVALSELVSGLSCDTKQDDMIRMLHAAVLKGYADAVCALLEKGAPVDAPDADGNTALHLAVMSDNIQMVQLVIEKEAAVGVKNSKGRTALHVSQLIDSPSTIRTLLKVGVAVDLEDYEDWRDPHSAAAFKTSVVKLLLNARAEVDVKDFQGMTPLHLAVSRGTSETIQVLLGAGAALGEKDFQERTVLHMAASNKYFEKPQILLNAATREMVKAQDSKGRTPLHIAAQHNNLVALQAFLTDRAAVDVQDSEGNTALHLAVQCPSDACVKALLAEGAAVKVEGSEGNTVLHLAAERGYRTYVEWFLAAGAAVEAKNSTGATALHLAMEKGHAEVARALKAAGAVAEA